MHSARLPRLSTLVRHLRVQATLRDPPGSHPLLCRGLWSVGFLHVLSTQHPVITEAIFEAEGKGCPAWRRFLRPKNRTHPLEDEPGQRSCLPLPGRARRLNFPPHRRGPLAQKLVHALNLDHHTLHQEAGRSPGCFRGCEEALPPGDGSAPFPESSVGIRAPFSDPQLRRGRLQTHSPHGKKALILLAQRPEVVNQLLCLHSHRHSGHRSLPSPTRPPPLVQAPPVQPQNNVLPAGNQPGYSQASSLPRDTFGRTPFP